jgi:hypothetical protein
MSFLVEGILLLGRWLCLQLGPNGYISSFYLMPEASSSETLYFITSNEPVESVQYTEYPVYLDHLKYV